MGIIWVNARVTMVFRWVIKLIWVYHGYYMGLYSYLRYYNYLKCLSLDHLDHWSTGVITSIYFFAVAFVVYILLFFLKSKRSRDPGDPPVILIENCYNNNWSTNDPDDPGNMTHHYNHYSYPNTIILQLFDMLILGSPGSLMHRGQRQYLFFCCYLCCI